MFKEVLLRRKEPKSDHQIQTDDLQIIEQTLDLILAAKPSHAGVVGITQTDAIERRRRYQRVNSFNSESGARDRFAETLGIG